MVEGYITVELKPNHNTNLMKNYWCDSFNVSDDETINIENWIQFLNKNEMVKDEFTSKTVFYFILFNAKSTSNEMNVNNLFDFVCSDALELYYGDFWSVRYSWFC